MTLSSKLETLLPKKRWQRGLLEAALIVVVTVGAQYWQTRGLPDDATPPRVGLLTDGSVARVGAGRTAMLVAYLSARGQTARLWWPETCSA